MWVIESITERSLQDAMFFIFGHSKALFLPKVNENAKARMIWNKSYYQTLRLFEIKSLNNCHNFYVLVILLLKSFTGVLNR